MYRVHDKESIKVNSRDATLFKLYEYSEDHGGYLFRGKYTAPAQASDDECIEAALSESEHG